MHGRRRAFCLRHHVGKAFFVCSLWLPHLRGGSNLHLGLIQDLIHVRFAVTAKTTLEGQPTKLAVAKCKGHAHFQSIPALDRRGQRVQYLEKQNGCITAFLVLVCLVQSEAFTNPSQEGHMNIDQMLRIKSSDHRQLSTADPKTPREHLR